MEKNYLLSFHSKYTSEVLEYRRNLFTNNVYFDIVEML